MRKRQGRLVGTPRALLAIVAILIASAAMAAPAPAPAAKTQKRVCANEKDMAALNARVLQTELMVAALSCEEKPRYNQFATSYQAVLIDRATGLRSFFQRTQGGQGTTRMNSPVTRLANDASKQSQMRADTYCQFAADLFGEVLRTPVQSFDSVANKDWIKSRHGVPACATAAKR